jgi:hypothetical protein
MSKIVFIGDSIGAPNSAIGLDESECYAAGVGTALGFGTVVNAHVGGNTQQDVINRWSDAAGAVAIEDLSGINDLHAAIVNNVPYQTFLADFLTKKKAMAALAKAQGAKLTIYSFFPHKEDPTSLSKKTRFWMPKTVKALERFCLAEGVGFFDLYTEFSAHCAGLSNTDMLALYSDGYHPSVPAHPVIKGLRLANAVYGDLETPPEESDTGAILTNALASTFGNITGKTVKNSIAASGLTPPSGTVTKMRFKLKSYSGEALCVNSLYGGPASGYGQLKLAGSATFTIPSGGNEITTDWLTTSWNKSDPVIVGLYCNGDTSSDALRADDAATFATVYLVNGNSANTATLSGTAYSNYLFVSGIETDGF